MREFFSKQNPLSVFIGIAFYPSSASFRKYIAMLFKYFNLNIHNTFFE